MSEDSNIRALAETATQQFRDQAYAKAIETLNKLRKLKEGSDPRIHHNIAVAEYYLGRCGDSQKLLDEFAKTQDAMDKSSTPSEGDSETSALTHADLDGSMLQYNKAVVYLRAKQYNTSLAILEELYSNIEPIEDYLAQRICFLLIDIYLLLKQTDKGFGVVNHLEKTLASVVKSDAQNQQEDDTENNSNNSSKSKSAPEDNNAPPKVPLKLTPNELKYLLHTYKAKLHLHSKPNLKAAKQEIKLAMVAGTKVHPLTVPSCMFLKAHLEYARQNHKKALKLMNACGQKNTMPASVATVPSENGCIGVNCSIDSSLAPLYFNNLGCISYKMKKFNAASFYFGKALRENASSSSEDSASSSAESSNVQGKKAQSKVAPPPPSPARDHQLEILYNMGVQLILTGKPELAFQAFQEAALVFYRVPSVWLRLAECCVAVHVLKLREEAKTRQKSSLIWKVSAPVNITKAGNTDSVSSSSRILLPVGGDLNKGLPIEDPEASAASEESEESSSSNIRMGVMSLEFAAKCLRNCLYLLQSNTVSESESSTDSANINNNNHINHNDDKEEGEHRTSDKYELLQAGLVNLAFVSLAMNNPVVALKAAEELLEIKNDVIDIFKYLGHIYAAEALLILNKPTQAIQHLNPQMLDEIFPPPPTSTPTPASAYTLVGVHPSPYSSLTSSQPVPNVARSMLCTNLAAAHILRDDVAQAQVCVSQALAYQPSSSRALLMQVYVDIRKGNTEAALDILKRGRPAPKRKTRR